MYLGAGQRTILWVNVLYLIIFGFLYLTKKNYEFVLYVGVIVIVLALILFTNKNIRYSNTTLWGLTLWGLIHMMGGAIPTKAGVLYGSMIIPLSSSLPILRYDQLVHMIGFGVATLLVFDVLKPMLDRKHIGWGKLGFIVVMAGLGIGGLNEIIEFITTLIVPQTGVGGYVNTALDLVADLVGAVVAFFLVYWKRKSNAL